MKKAINILILESSDQFNLTLILGLVNIKCSFKASDKEFVLPAKKERLLQQSESSKMEYLQEWLLNSTRTRTTRKYLGVLEISKKNVSIILLK